MRTAALAVLSAVWLFFAAELAVRLQAAAGRILAYLRSPDGLCDAAAVAIPLLGVALRLETGDIALLCGVWVAKFARNRLRSD